MTHRAFTRRVAIGLVACLGCGFLLGGLGWFSFRELEQTQARDLRQLRAMDAKLVELDRAFTAKVAADRGFALTRSARFLEERTEARRAFRDTLGALKRDAAPWPELEGTLVGMQALEHRHELNSMRLIHAARTMSPEEASAEFDRTLLPLRQELQDALDDGLEELNALFAAEAARAQEASSRAQRLLGLGMGLGLLLTCLLAWVLARPLSSLYVRALTSEERLQLITEYAQQISIFLLDSDGRVVDFSPAAERFTGYARKDVLGRPFQELFQGELLPERPRESAIERVARQGHAELEGPLIRADGSLRWVEASLLPSPEGKVLREVCILRDVTERKAESIRQELLARLNVPQLAEADLRTGAQRLAQLAVPLLGPSSFVAWRDANGSFGLLASAHAETSFDHALAELATAALQERPLGRALERVVETGRPQRFSLPADERARDELGALGARELCLLPLRGTGRSAGVWAIGCPPAAGDRLRALGMEEELARRASLFLQNLLLQEELAIAMDVVGTAAHDLGQPLNALHLRLAQLMRQEASGPGVLASGLERAEQQVARMREMLGNLLSLSRLAAGTLDPERVEVDLVSLVRQQIEDMQEQAAEAGCTVELNAPVPAVGTFDAPRLARAVANLLGNAFKFGRGAPVDVGVFREGGRARIEILDHGPGIQPEEQAQIFARFERSTGGRHLEGSGLGLYIVRKIVEAHGGEVFVRSVPGRGARFVIELPLAPVHGAGGPRPPEPLPA